MTNKYIKPETIVFEIDTLVILAGSPNGTTNGMDPNETPIDPNDIDARSFFFFEEREEEF